MEVCQKIEKNPAPSHPIVTRFSITGQPFWATPMAGRLLLPEATIDQAEGLSKTSPQIFPRQREGFLKHGCHVGIWEFNLCPAAMVILIHFKARKTHLHWGFPEMVESTMDGSFQGKYRTNLKWMIWGYSYFRNPPKRTKYPRLGMIQEGPPQPQPAQKYFSTSILFIGQQLPARWLPGNWAQNHVGETTN